MLRLKVGHFFEELIGRGKQRIPYRAEGRGVGQITLGKSCHGHLVMKGYGGFSEPHATRHLPLGRIDGGNAMAGEQINALFFALLS
jgi:hypothetical protein